MMNAEFCLSRSSFIVHHSAFAASLAYLATNVNHWLSGESDMEQVEVLVATDIETDGPSPGHYSMLSFASVAFRLDKSVISTFERNLELLPGARQATNVM